MADLRQRKSLRTPILLWLISILAVMLPAGCAVEGGRVINLMPAPDALADPAIDPFVDNFNTGDDPPYHQLLFATDRAPVENDGQLSYGNERGGVLRLGSAKISLGDGNIDWEEARRISLLKNRPGKYPLKVASVSEFGILDSTIHEFLAAEARAGYADYAEASFTEAINTKLERSALKDIVIYVHGYKVVFENPLLVMAELWHFLGYEGVGIAYSWPATPKRTAYFADAESADVASLNFRHFLEYLARDTQTRRIHIIGYSAGTRMVARALQDLALIANDDVSAANRYKLGTVILTGSDIDRQRFGGYLSDGILNLMDEMLIYTSATDKALAMSKWTLGKRDRLGQAFSDLDPNSPITSYLQNTPKLTVVNVTDTEGAQDSNGHGYFRSSPWTSSDILSRLRWDLTPSERGLTQNTETGIWRFPEDYVERLRAAIMVAQQTAE